MSSVTAASDSSQDASGTSTSLTPESSPNVSFMKSTLSAPKTTSAVRPIVLGSGSGILGLASNKGDPFQRRRSSSRSIKRKKFDDELVESSLVKTTRTRPLSGSFLTLPSGSTIAVSSTGIGGSSSGSLTTTVATPTATNGNDANNSMTGSDHVASELQHIPHERKKPKSIPKRVKKSKNAQAYITKDLGRWKPADDLALILCVQQTHDLEAVHRGVKFSCKFTLQEVQERWFALLYDPVISKVAVNAMKQLHADVIAQVQAKVLFSREEEKILSTVTSTSQPTLETFQELLSKYPEVFLPERTAKSLLTHWSLMKQYHLLPDQTVQPLPRGEHVLNFSDAEDMLDDIELIEPKDESLEHELSIADRAAKREIRQLENELPKWQVLVDSITGVSPPDFDNQTLAVLRGRLVRYLMRSREITLGRASKDGNIDVDLSLEGPAWKISRRQGVIKLDNCGDFFVTNEGRRPIYIDGKPVLTGTKYKLSNNSVVEIAGLRFIFLVNQELINAIRTEAAKTAN